MSYSQNDLRWKNEKIGFDTGPNDTIGNYGCYMTAIANVCAWAGYDHTPDQINGLAKQNGWLVRMDEIARDDIPSLLCSNLTFEGRTNWTDAVSMNFFADASSPDVAYIIKIDASHAPGVQSHFVMVWAKDGDNDLIIEDSWDGARKPLSHYGNPSVIIYSAMKFIKRHDAPAPPPVVQPAVVTPPPTPLPPTPYVAPTGAAPVKRAEQYTLVTSLPYYSSLIAIQNTQSASGQIPAGIYYVWEKGGVNNTYYNLTSDNTKNMNHWVNSLYNKVTPKSVTRDEVTVEPIIAPTAPSMTTSEIRASYRSIPDGPMDVSAKQNVLVTDIVGSGSPITVRTGTIFHIYGTFRKNDQWYALPKIDAADPQAANYMYGIPIASSTSLEPFLEAAYGYPERISYGLQQWYDKTIQIIDGVFRPKKKPKQ